MFVGWLFEFLAANWYWFIVLALLGVAVWGLTG